MAQIIGIGANVFDTLFRLDHFPTEDKKQQAQSVTESGGGPCGTGLVAAAKLGASAAFIGNCSDDRAGQFLQADFQKYGVDTAYMTPVANTTAFASCIWKKLKLSGTDLCGADFFGTSLRGMDLSDCIIAGISVSDNFRELQGLTISSHQALELVRLLGVKLKA